jgi:hypothetical protein
MSAVENFPILLSEAEEESSAVPPCFSNEGINVRRNPHSHSPSGDVEMWKVHVFVQADAEPFSTCTFVTITSTSSH